MTPRNPADWIALNLLPGLGPIRQRLLLELHGEPGHIAHRLPRSAFAALPRINREALDAIDRARPGLARRADTELRRCRELGIEIVACDAADYPAAFELLGDAPILLYVRGALPEGVVRVAIVGSRSPTAYGRRLSAGLAAGLAVRGVEIVSGGARGIDTLAHRGALEERGRTVAVLGAGLARPYPTENHDLFDKIAARGALISEFPLEFPVSPANFPRRNRLISALAAAVVVVEAAERSGSLITAHHALDQGREVLAVPGPVSSAKSAGCHRLIQHGAKLVQNIEDILEELPPLYRVAVGPEAAGTPPADLRDLTQDERAVLDLLDPVEAVHLDELAAQALFGIARLQAALFGLEVRGAVDQSAGGYYVLRLSEAEDSRRPKGDRISPWPKPSS